MRARIVRQIRVPAGAIARSDFALGEAEVARPGGGELLVRALYISIDPYLVMRLRGGDFAGGRVCSRLIGRVETSCADGFAEGDLVLGFGEWAERLVMPAADARLLRPKAPLPAYLGVIGHSGYTATLGMALLDVQPGHVFSVSSAAGMVGMVAGQLAKLAGARVIGIAGGAKAAALVDRLGFDAGIDWRRDDLTSALSAAAPDGIDRHFENVGAAILDPVLDVARRHARIALCGLIAHYQDDEAICFRRFREMLFKGVTIAGFNINDHLDEYEGGLARLESLVLSGRLASHEVVTDGIARLPEAFVAMLAGAGFGKHMVRVAAE